MQSLQPIDARPPARRHEPFDLGAPVVKADALGGVAERGGDFGGVAPAAGQPVQRVGGEFEEDFEIERVFAQSRIGAGKQHRIVAERRLIRLWRRRAGDGLRRRLVRSRQAARDLGLHPRLDLGVGRLFDIRPPRDRRVHHPAQRIGRLDQDAPHLGVERDALVAHQADEILGDMGKLLDDGQPEQAGIALEGVQRPEQRGDRLPVVAAVFERGQRFLDRPQRLPAVVLVKRPDLVDLVRHGELPNQRLRR